MTKKISIIFLLFVTISLSIGVFVKISKNDNEYIRPVYTKEELDEFYEKLPDSIKNKYSVNQKNLVKLGVNLEKDYSTSDMNEFIIVLNERPANVQYQLSNQIKSMSDYQENINSIFNGFYEELNINDSGIGSLGLIEDLEDEISIGKTYTNSIVGMTATMPAEYLYKLIEVNEVALVFENETVKLEEPDMSDLDSYLPEQYQHEISTLMHQTRGFLGIDSIHDGTWNSNSGQQLTGANVNVAIIDSGIDYTHPDLAPAVAGYNSSTGKVELEGAGHWDFIDEDNDPQEATPEDFIAALENYEATGKSPVCAPLQEYYTTTHGTHVAGTIASQANVYRDAIANDPTQDKVKNVRGLAPDVTLYGLRALGPCGSGSFSGMIDALEYVSDLTYEKLESLGQFNYDNLPQEVKNVKSRTDLVIDVVNMSLGGGYSLPSHPMNIAANNLADLGVVVVVAGGNAGYYGDYTVDAPGSANKVITVGAAPADYFVEQVSFKFNNSDYVMNALGYNDFDTSFTDIVNSLESSEIVYVEKGQSKDFRGKNLNGKIALIERGEISFFDKFLNAKSAGAEAVVIFNDRPNEPIFAYYGAIPVFKIPVFTMNKDNGFALKSAVESNQTEKIDITSILSGDDKIQLENKEMAMFSSMGPAMSSLTIKPDIVAPGVNIYSTVPRWDGVTYGKELLPEDESYGHKSGTSMACPHVTGIAALMIQNYRYNLGIWDTMPLNERAQYLKTVMMNTADHEVYSAGEFDVDTYEITDYSVYKRSAGLINPQRALLQSDDTMIYSEYTLEFKYYDNEKSGQANSITVLEEKQTITGLLNYGLIIGNEQNDVSRLDYNWADRKVTIDNRNNDTEKYYYIEYQPNNSKYSENSDNLKFNVTTISDGTSETNYSTWEYGDDKYYWMDNTYGKYIKVPAGEKVFVTIELVKMASTAQEGFYEGYFKFHEVEKDVNGSVKLYNPDTFDPSNFSLSEEMFTPSLYHDGGEKEFSLPFAFKYVQPGAHFSFRYPFTTTNVPAVSSLYGEFYSDMADDLRIYIKDAETGEYLGILPNVEIVEGVIKGYNFYLGAFENKTYYAPHAGGCGYTPTDAPDGIEFDNIPDSCERIIATHGIYEFEVHGSYYYIDENNEKQTKEFMQDEIYIYVHNRPPKIEFKADDADKPSVFVEPGVYEITEDDIDANGYIWIKGKMHDDALDEMNEYASEEIFDAKINQGNNHLVGYINGSAFVGFIADIEDDGTFEIGIHKDDVLNKTFEIRLIAKGITFVESVYQVKFVFADPNAEYYSYEHDKMKYDLGDEQGFTVSANNFQQVVEGMFKIRLRSVCSINEIVPTEEFQQYLDRNELTVKIDYNMPPKSELNSLSLLRVDWEITGEGFSGLNGDMDLFEVRLGSVCKDMVNYSYKGVITAASLEDQQLMPIKDILGRKNYIPTFNISASDGNGVVYRPIKVDFSFISHNLRAPLFYGINEQKYSSNFGYKVKIIAPNGEVIDGRVNRYQAYFTAQIPIGLDGDYVVEVSAPGHLPARDVFKIKNINAAGETDASIYFDKPGSLNLVAGDINNDGIIDVRDAYYLTFLDDNDYVNLVGSGKSKFRIYKDIFESIVTNFGAVSYLIDSDDVEILNEYGGYTIYELALILGYGDYSEETNFVDFDKVKVDPNAETNFWDTTCTYVANIDEFFLDDEILPVIDEDGNGMVDTCELNKVTHLNIPSSYNFSNYNVNGFLNLINLKEISVVNNYLSNQVFDIFSNSGLEKTLHRATFINTAMTSHDLYRVFYMKDNLKSVIARDNDIDDLDYIWPSGYAASIETLDLTNNNISSLKFVDDHKSIKYLYLANNKITSLEGLENAYNLEVLDLRGNNVIDLTPLSRLSNLKILLIDDNYINDLSPLKNLNSLKVLSLKNNNVSTIIPIKDNPSLEVLNLSNTTFNNTSELSNLTNLRNLYLENLGLESIDGIESIVRLVELNLNKNYIDMRVGSKAYSIIESLRKVDGEKRSLLAGCYDQMPIIELSKPEININVGDDFVDPMGEIILYGKNTPSKEWENNVVVTGSVDTSKAGTYEIKYDYKKDGKIASTVTRVVNVVSQDNNETNNNTDDVNNQIGTSELGKPSNDGMISIIIASVGLLSLAGASFVIKSKIGK